MSNKKKKQTNAKRSTKADLLALRDKLAAHAAFVCFVIAGAAIGYTLLHAHSYLSPERDEERYSEGASKLNYSKIDQKILTRLKESQNQQGEPITPLLAPGRTNPFAD